MIEQQTHDVQVMVQNSAFFLGGGGEGETELVPNKCLNGNTLHIQIHYISNTLKLCNINLYGFYHALFTSFLNVGAIFAAHLICRHADGDS